MAIYDNSDEKFTQEEKALVGELLTSLVDGAQDAANRLIKRLMRHGSKIVSGRRFRSEAFEQRLYHRWGGALELYDICLYLAQECGEHFSKSFRPKGTDPKFEVLVRLHAGASRVAGEIL